MKKTIRGGLKLRTETVRQLTGADLRQVVGGMSGMGRCTNGTTANNIDTCSTYEDTVCYGGSVNCPPQNSYGVCW